MAHSRSAKKRVLQAAKRGAANRAHKSRIHTVLRRVEEALAAADRDQAETALKQAEPVLARGVGKGVLHRNRAARTVSRLSRRVQALGSAPKRKAASQSKPSTSKKKAAPSKKKAG